MLPPVGTPRRELAALGLAFLVAPPAFGAVSAFDGWLLWAVLDGVGVKLDEFVHDLLRMFGREIGSALLVGYVVSCLTVFPPVVLLRARGWLSLWTAVGCAVVIPSAGAATMSLQVRWQSRGSASGMALTFLYLSYLVVPGSVAVAVVFWRVYSFVAGKRFVTRLTWGEIAPAELAVGEPL